MSLTDPVNPEQPEQHPYRQPSQRSPSQPPGGARLGGAIAWVVIVLIAGGALASYCVLRFGERGLFVVWPLGWISGVVAAKILGGRSQLVGGLLVVACFGMTTIAEVYWIHEKIDGADESWFKAISLLPAFIQQFQISAFIALVISIIAAISAWRGVAARYVRVRIDD